jgi:hypothetical protein
MPSWQFWIAMGVPVAAQMLVAAYVYGQLTQGHKDHGERLDRHNEKLEEQGSKLFDHAERISRIEGANGIQRD